MKVFMALVFMVMVLVNAPLALADGGADFTMPDPVYDGGAD